MIKARWKSAVYIVMALLAVPAVAQAPEDALGIPGPINFGDSEYMLAWSAQPSEGYFAQEYLPADQRLNDYRDMFHVEAIFGGLSPIHAASMQIDWLEKRRSSDPFVALDHWTDDETGAVLLEFVISDIAADPIVMEWNAYRYMPMAGAEGVVLYGISRRTYGSETVDSFLTAIEGRRDGDLDELARLNSSVSENQ